MTARSPSSALAIVDETGARGKFTTLVLLVTILMDVTVIVLYVVFEREAREFQSFHFFVFSITSLKLEVYHSHLSLIRQEKNHTKIDARRIQTRILRNSNSRFSLEHRYDINAMIAEVQLGGTLDVLNYLLNHEREHLRNISKLKTQVRVHYRLVRVSQHCLCHLLWL